MIRFNYGSGKDTLFYDFDNRATRLVKQTTGLPTIYDTLWFNYCGQGKRIRKIEKPNGENPDTTVYAYDGMYAVCEFGGHLDLQYKYIYANGVLLDRYDGSAADSHYYHHDGLGSIMGLTNESGNVEQSYFYDEFGNFLGSWGSVTNHYLYTGQEYDGSISSLYNLRARYYDMRIGRFVSEDPILGVSIHIPALNPHDMNAYLYVLSNPINFIDPLGEGKCTPERVVGEIHGLLGIYEKFRNSPENTGACADRAVKLANKLRPHTYCCEILVIYWPTKRPWLGPITMFHAFVEVECMDIYKDITSLRLDPGWWRIWPIIFPFPGEPVPY